MLLKMDDGYMIRITRIHYGRSPDEAEYLEGYWVDSELPLSDQELNYLNDAHQSELMEAWAEHQYTSVEDDESY